jgi:hypothetical protein
MPLFVPLEVYRSGGLAQVNLDRVDYIRPVSDGVSAIFFRQQQVGGRRVNSTHH